MRKCYDCHAHPWPCIACCVCVQQILTSCPYSALAITLPGCMGFKEEQLRPWSTNKMKQSCDSVQLDSAIRPLKRPLLDPGWKGEHGGTSQGLGNTKKKYLVVEFMKSDERMQPRSSSTIATWNNSVSSGEWSGFEGLRRAC